MFAATPGVVEGTNQVHRQNSIESLSIELFCSDSAGVCDACVVDQDINFFMGLKTGGNDIFHVCFYRDVSGYDGDFAAVRSAFFTYTFKQVGAPCGQNEICAALSEGESELLAEAIRGTRDQHCFFFEIEHELVSF